MVVVVAVVVVEVVVVKVVDFYYSLSFQFFINSLHAGWGRGSLSNSLPT